MKLIIEGLVFGALLYLVCAFGIRKGLWAWSICMIKRYRSASFSSA